MDTELLTTLMDRDNLSREEALAQIGEAAALVLHGANPEEILEDEFGLEPDYVFDLLKYCSVMQRQRKQRKEKTDAGI